MVNGELHGEVAHGDDGVNAIEGQAPQYDMLAELFIDNGEGNPYSLPHINFDCHDKLIFPSSHSHLPYNS